MNELMEVEPKEVPAQDLSVDVQSVQKADESAIDIQSEKSDDEMEVENCGQYEDYTQNMAAPSVYQSMWVQDEEDDEPE